MEKGEYRGSAPQKGRSPFGRGLGVSPRYNIPPSVEGSFLARKGVRGMVERVFQHPASEGQDTSKHSVD